MKIQFWSVGRSHEAYVKSGVEAFTKRISNYFPVEWMILPLPKLSGSLSEIDQVKKEGTLILEKLKPEDSLVALDERGRMLSSQELAGFIQARANESIRNLVFLIGGAYGLDPRVIQKSSLQWSLSRLTFPHQLVRLILAEQVYRACSILRNEKYHHS